MLATNTSDWLPHSGGGKQGNGMWRKTEVKTRWMRRLAADSATSQSFSESTKVPSEPMIGGDGVPVLSVKSVNDHLVSSLRWTFVAFVFQIDDGDTIGGQCSPLSHRNHVQGCQPSKLVLSKLS